MVGLTEVARLLVRVTGWAVLAVPTVCVAKVSEVGENERGRAAVPFTSRICSPTAALSVITTAPLTLPLAPKAGENVTDIVQLAPAVRFRPAPQGFVPLPEAENSPLEAIAPNVTAPALLFFTVTVLPVLVVPTACPAKERLLGVNVNGGALPPEPVPDRATSCGLNDVHP